MQETLSRGMNIYYRGYVIHEDIRSLYYTIYGMRPERQEMASTGTSRQAMEWVDRLIAEQGPPSLMVWSSLFTGTPLSAMTSL
ncbi:MAG: hypothetical protein O2909_07990 [Chloroflexi bacterium]|nr:hypothetical protein [Chloroflexota bacterium]MDA1219368.1 hypothetical protein [Chloroflexota bacterium]PKB57654.1 MAG: hypothetical protein BZY73_01995 [SAR202 cluster bacterium Casp-Chloro-G3]